MNSFWIHFFIGAVAILHSCSCEKRLIEYAPPWQPVAIPAAAPQLISIGNFDATNKAQIAQIAHHNAQILRQIKGLHPPVTQYLNPFPVFPSANSQKQVVMASALPSHNGNVPTTQHLLSSSSNVAQTVMPQTIMKSYLGSKPTYISAGKPSEFKFFNGMASTSKVPPIFLSQASSSMPSLQLFSTTSRVPILRDVTLSSPSSMFKSTQLPNPQKYQQHMAFGPAQRPVPPNQIPGQILSSFTHYGPAAPQILRGDPKQQRIRANFLTAPFDHYHFGQTLGNPYAGHLTPGGHFVAKNNFANSLYFPHNGLGSYQLTNTFIASPQKPNSQAFVQSQQQHGPLQQPVGPPQLPETQPSYLPQLPTVPPSVLSPFFQVQQKQQEQSTTAAPQILQESQQNSHSNTYLLNDEYTINLVPPPPYKHTDSTRFRLRQPPSSTPSTLNTVQSTNSTPIGPPGNDIFDDEQQKAMDILTKYNIPAISPLQDANRFAYNSGQFVRTSTTPPTPSYSDEHIFQRWPANDNIFSNSPSFTTEKPNIFRNLNRPIESEYHQHKLMHPGYTGARRPSAPSTTPFLPTADSLNNAITHSFFTIEDAITISPHYNRRPVKPTNTNEIEANIKRPSNEIYTETASVDPFLDFEKNMGEEIVTMPPPPPPPSSTSTPRPRNKLRRKRPRPTTEATSTVFTEQHNQVNNQVNNQFNNQFKLSDFDEPSNEVLATEMPKNHKEYTATRDRGQLIQYTRETTTEVPRESSTNEYRNSNRLRNRTRTSTPFESRFESSTTAAPIRPKRPYNPENRRPNNRFEDNNKIQRQRPQAEKSTRLPLEEHEQTTIGQREYSRPSRRPLTTQQAIPISTTLQDETETHDFFLDAKLTNRIRNSSPTSIITTSLLTPTIDSGRPDENQSVLSTRLNIANEAISTHEPEDSTNSVDEDTGTSEPQTQDSVSLSSPSSSATASTSTSSTSSTSTISSSSTSSEKSENSSESAAGDSGPVYIRDETKIEVNNFRTRQRMRNKEKILEAVAAATSSQTKAVTKDRGHGFAHHQNDVNDIENESSSTEKEPRLRVRLPVYKAGTKQVSEEVQFSNVTKAIRLNGTNKFDPKNRPRFSIKEYRQRMSSTTPTPDQSSSNVVSTTASYTRLRFPTRQRVLPSELKNRTVESNKIDEKPNIIYPEKSTVEPSSTESGVSTETTRKRFVPKDRFSSRLKTTTETIVEGQTNSSPTTPSQVTTSKPPIRRVSTRRDPLNNRTRTSSTTTDNPSDTSSTVSRIPTIRNGTVPLRRPQAPSLRQRIQSQKKKEVTSSTISADESLNDLAVEGSSEDKVRLSSNEVAPSITSTSTEENKHETAIMKIAKDDHSYRPYKEKPTTEKTKGESSSSENDLNDSPSEQSERVAELTIFGSNQFNSVNTGSASRRIPGYFTLATEDPILPIEAFFPQVKRNK